MSRLAPALALLVLCALLIVGCGGGEEEPTATTGTATATEKQGPQGKAGKAGSKQQGDAQQGKARQGTSPATPEGGVGTTKTQRAPVGNPIPGSKAVAPGVPTVKGGDNSIQSFGTEGSEDPREQAVSNLLAYLDARLAGEFERACSLASEEFRQQLARLIANAKAKGDAEKPQGCAETLALFTPDKAKAALREKSQVDEVLSFRIEGPYAYLIFKGAEGKAMFIAMADDGGEWKVNVPEPGAFTLPATSATVSGS